MENNALPSKLPLNRKLLNASLIQTKIGAHLYDDLSHHLLEICDCLDLAGDIKFLGRYILDLVITYLPPLAGYQTLKIGLACLLVAIDLIQPKDSHGQHLSLLQDMTEISTEELQEFQTIVKQIVDISQQEPDQQNSYSPYHFVQALKASSQSQGALSNAIKGLYALIDLAMTHPKLSEYSSSEIYLGSLQAMQAMKVTALQDDCLVLMSQFVHDTNIDEVKSFLLGVLST